ncbi:hypothetical protein GOD21_12855 [Sinorhizobium medicae]|nr:hypothetical protein [Sinorhizobium medicae]
MEAGGFTGWLAERLPHIPERSAFRAIEIFKGLDSAISAHWADISIKALAEVAKAEPDIQALIAARL